MRLSLGLGLPSGGGGAAFSPLSLAPDLFLLARPPYLFQGADGATPVTAPGQAVRSFAVQGGLEGLYISQATAGSRPAYRNTGGLHSIEFDGTDDFMSVATFSALAQPIFACAAFSHGHTFPGDGSRYVFDGVASRAALIMNETAQSRYNLFAGDTATFDDVVSGAQVATAVFDGASSMLRINGVEQTIADAVGANALDGLTIGAGNGGAFGFLGGHLHGLFIRSGEAPTAAGILQLELYMAGISGAPL